MTTPYQKGRAIEYKCANELKKQGYFVQRSAGSHSCIDLIGVDINNIRLIQVKSVKNGKYAKYNYKEPNIRKLCELPVPSNCRKELWIWMRENKKWRKEILTEY